MIVSLQNKLGLKADGDFGPATLAAATKYFGLNNIQAAHFFGQCAHESANFTVSEENLNYSAEGLLRTFPKYFDAASAREYARQPERIANRVYGNRMGNTDIGDGWKYRGRGPIELTGRDNYRSFGRSIKDMSILDKPEKVSNELAFESAMFFFKPLLPLCTDISRETVTILTRKINGGLNGLEDRIAKTNKFWRK